MRPVVHIYAPTAAATWGSVSLPPLRESVVVSRGLDGEIALLDIGCGRVVVVGEDDLGALIAHPACHDGLYTALLEAGFIATDDTGADPR
jgi:hypothetical protein